MNLKGFTRTFTPPPGIYEKRYKKVRKGKEIFYVTMRSKMNRKLFDFTCDLFAQVVTEAKKVKWRNGRLYVFWERSILICDNIKEEMRKEILRRTGL